MLTQYNISMTNFNFNGIHYVIGWRYTQRHKYRCLRIENTQGRIPVNQKQIIIDFINCVPELRNQFHREGWNNITIKLLGVKLSPTTHELISFLLRV